MEFVTKVKVKLFSLDWVVTETSAFWKMALIYIYICHEFTDITIYLNIFWKIGHFYIIEG